MSIGISLAYVADDGVAMYDECRVPQGTSIYEALQQSGWLHRPSLAQFATWCGENLHQDPNHKAWYVGIYSQKRRLDTVLMDGDRIEIYRPLSYDPMSRRKQKSKSTMKSKSAKT